MNPKKKPPQAIVNIPSPAFYYVYDAHPSKGGQERKVTADKLSQELGVEVSESLWCSPDDISEVGCMAKAEFAPGHPKQRDIDFNTKHFVEALSKSLFKIY